MNDRERLSRITFQTVIIAFVISSMIFCPLCHCLLLVQKSVNQMLFICYSCPYFHPVFEKVKKKTVFNNPMEDEIFGESKTDTMEGICSFT